MSDLQDKIDDLQGKIDDLQAQVGDLEQAQHALWLAEERERRAQPGYERSPLSILLENLYLEPMCRQLNSDVLGFARWVRDE